MKSFTLNPKLIFFVALLSLPCHAQLSNDDRINQLYETYGTIELIVENLDQLDYETKELVRSHLTNLELKRLTAIGEQTFKLEKHESSKSKKYEMYRYEQANNAEDILKKRKIKLEAEQAQYALLVNPPESLIDTIEFDPSIPQELLINVYPGFPSAISFYDATGAPWPVLQVKLGAKGIFTAQKSPLSMISMEALKPGAQHSGWFVLQDLDTVVPFRISSKYGPYVNTRRQIAIPQIGPNARPEKMTSTQKVHAESMGKEAFAFINGTARGIAGAEVRTVTGIPAIAYLYNDYVYLRTTAELKGATGTLFDQSSQGNFNLYKLSKRAFYWFSYNGNVVKGYVNYDK